jgi:hypothetical protein
MTAAGEPALRGEAAALTSTALTGDRLRLKPEDAAAAQGTPPPARVGALLDEPAVGTP